jgi:TPR repeat protein
LYNLGIIYTNGEGVKESLRNSTFWFAKAAGNGDLQSAYYLAEAYETGEGVPKDLKMAFDLYKGVAGEALLFE